MDNYEGLKKRALERRRRIIYDNDGCDVLYFCREATRDELLKQRMYKIPGTGVDTVFCASMSSGFGQFTHDTKIGSVFTSRESEYRFNMTEGFINQGTDHFRIVSEFCRENGIEIFWQMRMNDTHDGGGATTWYSDIILNGNKLKNEHPEWLMGTGENLPKYGCWSAVDYAVPEIRELVLKFIDEICSRYYVDGIELDFFRHPVFFRNTSEGKPVEQEEIDKMTGLMREVKKLVENHGRALNRPLLIAVRVPDSVEYSKAIGIDIEKWLEEGLVDILLTTSYIQLNNWEYSVSLGHRYGIKVYPSLDENRIRDPEGKTLRESVKCYRARAMNALRAGMDGIYLFNYIPSDANLFNEIENIHELNKLDKTYVASVRGPGRIAGGGLPHGKYIKIPVLNPDEPLALKPGAEENIAFFVGDDVQWGDGCGIRAKISLGIRLRDMEKAEKIFVKFNGTVLKEGKTNTIWVEYDVCADNVKTGMNNVALCLQKDHGRPVELLDIKLDIGYCRGNAGEK